MSRSILIAGSGFAGTWAALAAARAIDAAAAQDAVSVTVISPAPSLVMRPRLYEATIDGMAPDLSALFAAAGIRHCAGTVEAIDWTAKTVDVARADGSTSRMSYDGLVLATGSNLHRPRIDGLQAHAFDVDQLDGAQRLAEHLRSLARRPASSARDTVVIGGGGFTGIEVATEMRDRLKAILGNDAPVRVVLVERAPAIGPDLGPGPRSTIETALAACGVETITGAEVIAMDAESLTLANGMRIATQTVVWTGGARANRLTALLPGERDAYGRIRADAMLRSAAAGVFVAGDVAHAATDDRGNVTLMSCQHALGLGRVAGYNVAAEQLGLPLHPYSQQRYVTCLDLGPWGAVLTEGWDRQVQLTGAEGKALKREINTKWIYPPAANRAEAFATARPDHVVVG